VAQKKKNPAPYGKGDTSWFVKERFGMFIHFGLFALPAQDVWLQSRESIPAEKYRNYFDHFNPDLFDPAAWARAAREAGMKYLVIITKHHEGFCLWDTAYTDFKITNTPFGRDLIREVVDAFRAEGLRIGFYYSLLDWNHPDFPVDLLHPLHNEPDREELNRGRDMRRYAKYMRDQVTELLTGYGKIDIIWFDFSYADLEGGKGAKDWESEKLIRLARKLQPNIIVDNRLDLPEASDFQTPEQYTPETALLDENGNPAVWEGCHTFSGSWGYNRDERTWKTPKQCIDLLVNHVSRNGNLLMNVGPTARGCFDERALACLNAYGQWMKYHSRAIRDCQAAPAEFPEPMDCRYTYNPETKRLYLHLLNWPFRHLQLKNLGDKLEYAQFLHDGGEVRYHTDKEPATCGLGTTEKNAVTLDLPTVKPPVEVPVIEIFLKA